MTILAIDGNSIVNRAFYGIKLLSTKDGRFTNGIYGFLNILLSLLESEQPDAVAVAFDLRAPTFRHRQYAEYKAGRKGMPDELASQIEPLKDILRLMGYAVIEQEGYEADDILGTLVELSGRRGDKCIIATGDRDSLQLVSEKTNVLLASTQMGRPQTMRYDTQKILEDYGVTPPQLIDIKALQGDSSDNIPGVKGVGAKTAGELIGRFGTLDNLYENIDSPDIKQSVRQKLEADRDMAYLSRSLGTICREVPLNAEYDSYKTAPMDKNALSAALAGLEMFRIIDRLKLPLVQSSPAASESADVPPQPEQTDDISQFMSGRVAVAVTDGKAALATHTHAGLFDIAEAAAVLGNPDIQKTVHDTKATLHALCGTLRGDTLLCGVCFDVSLAAYLLNPSAGDYSALRLAGEYSVLLPESAAVPDAEPTLFDLAADEPGHDSLINDAVRTFFLSAHMEELVEKAEMSALLHDIEIPLAYVLYDMESLGFGIDREGLAAFGRELKTEIDTLEAEIYELIGYSFNLNSPKQLGEALFEKLGLPSGRKTKSGYSTDAEVLEGLREHHPCVDKLLSYRQLVKLKSTYCDGMLKVIAPDSRIHSTFNQTETRTGRISSIEPNMQNIPVRTARGAELRRFFTAGEGKLLADADYSQIELRVLAHISGDKNMIEAFQTDADIHTLTAAQVNRVSPEEVTPAMRREAKAVNFGIVYGIGAFSLAKDLGISRARAEDYIEGYLQTYSGVREYMRLSIQQAKERGYSVTMFGRRRYLPELSASNANIRNYGERVARNMPIQGTAADIIKIAMICVHSRLKEELPEARLILQVHDELIVETPEEFSDKVCKLLQEEMQKAVNLTILLKADAKSGKTWYNAKG